MTNDVLVKGFLMFSAVVAALVAVFPNAFFYLASYGGRLKYTPSPGRLVVVRVLAAIVAAGIVLNFRSL